MRHVLISLHLAKTRCLPLACLDVVMLFGLPARTAHLFLFLSVLDYALTWLLLRRDGADEANPLAAWWLDQHGWLGLAAFKIAAVLAAIIARRRRDLARRVLGFACATATVVVLNSAGMTLAAAVRIGPTPDDLAAQEQHLNAALDRGERYRSVLMAASEAVAANRLSLEEAADRLAQTAQGTDPEWLVKLRREFPGLDDRKCLAANVAQFTLGRLRYQADATEVTSRLRSEMLLLCGAEVPLNMGPATRAAPEACP